MSYPSAALLGVVAGMRSQFPLALLAWAERGSGGANPLPPALRGLAGRGLLLSAVGEVVGDKLPRTPSRLAARPLGGRLALGAAAGAAVTRGSGEPAVPAAVLGAVGAAAGAYASYHLRAALGRWTPVPDPVWGAIEDVAALGLGLSALQSAGSRGPN